MKELEEILSGAEPVREEPVATAEPATEPEKREPETPAEPERAEQPRSADGKYAPKEAAPGGGEEGDGAEPDKKGTVPQKALHAAREKERQERDRADRLERELAELRGKVDGMSQQRQPVAEPPKKREFWEAPDEFVADALNPLQQDQLADRMTFSHELAVTRHGEETVQQAMEALKSAVASGEVDGNAVAAKLTRARHPINEIVQWHKNSPAVRESELRASIRAELMAELGGDKPSEGQPKAQPSVMPSDLAGARNVGTRSAPAWAGPASINDIFDRSRSKTG